MSQQRRNQAGLATFSSIMENVKWNKKKKPDSIISRYVQRCGRTSTHWCIYIYIYMMWMLQFLGWYYYPRMFLL